MLAKTHQIFCFPGGSIYRRDSRVKFEGGGKLNAHTATEVCNDSFGRCFIR